MKLRNVFCSVMAAAMAFVACDKKEDFGTPAVSISASEIVLSSEAGDTTITVTATRDWTVTVDEAAAEWLAVDPVSGSPSTEAQTVTLSYFSNDGYDREASVAFSIGMQTKYLTVVQKGAKGSADALIIYSNNFDKEPAVEVQGKGWPYADNSDIYKNQTGSGAANVTYASSGVTVRNNSNSNGSYSDYAGSGVNNIFFGKSPYFAVHGIDLGGAVDLELTFGTEKYSKNDGSVFLNSEYHIWLSTDGKKWVELTGYKFAGGEVEGRWNVASANFSVPAGTSTLSICMAVDVASAYRLDDLKLVQTATPGTKIDFSAAVEKDFGSSAGGNGGGDNGGGEVTPPADAFFVETFANGIGDFTIENKNLPAELEYVWIHQEYNDSKYMKATAFKSVAYAAESWLISPEIDLTNATTAYLSFDHTGKYFSDASKETTVWASKNGTDWTQLTIQNYTDNWKWVPSGNIDLKDFVGGKMKFAFKYLSSSSNAPTWEINNVCISATGATSGGDSDGGTDGGTDGGDNGDNGDGGEDGGNTDGGNTDVDEPTWTVNQDKKAYTEEAKVNGESVSVIKLGSSSASGEATLNVPAGTSKITFYAVSWKDKPSTLTLSAGGAEIASISPAVNDGAYDKSPYTITVTDSDKYTVDIPENATQILFKTSGSSKNQRVVIFKVTAE